MFSLEGFVNLPLVWYGLIAAAIFIYVLLDGFDLGVGILFPFAPEDRSRDIMMNSVAPFWDGNETWLVLGAGGLLAAFPMAYAVLMPAFYMPVIIMLLGLILRGTAFEFRSKASIENRRFWDFSFHAGSLLAAFMQGVILGGFVQGVEITGRSYAGGAFDWLSFYSLFTGAALVFGYSLLGSTWLVMKTEGLTRNWAAKTASRVLPCLLFFFIVVSISMPVINSEIRGLWFSMPDMLFLLPLPAASLALMAVIRQDLHSGRENRPFLLSFVLFLTGYAGIAISIWPYIVPFEITFRRAAAAPESQSLLLVGTAVLLPLILGYVSFCYYILRGKVTQEIGY